MAAVAENNNSLLIKPPAKYINRETHELFKEFKCEEICSYSCDGENMFLPDDSQIRYLCMPDDPEDVLFDLKVNFDTYIERDRSHEMIDRVLKCLQHIEKKGDKKKHKEAKEEEDEDDDLAALVARLQLDPVIICRRGLLTEIMTTPYQLQNKKKEEGWSITAIKYNNQIFLLRNSKATETWGTEEERKLSTYTGSKFEQYVSKKTPDGPSIADLDEIVDTRKGHYSMTKAQLGGHKLMYGGEVDCCDLEVKGSKRKYVQFKTTAPLQDPPKYFQSLKLLRWWAQATLVGISKIVCGIKDHDAIVFHVKTYKVENLPETCNNQWNPSACFGFLDSFLSHVKEVLGEAPDDASQAHIFKWTPGENRVKYEHILYLAPESEYSFLPEWFTNPEEK